MQVSYSNQAPATTAANTEITTYMWPGFLGEFDHATHIFTAWELTGPTLWTPRPDIAGPPFECIGVCTMKTQTWTSAQQQKQMDPAQKAQDHWMRQGPVSRRLVSQG